MQGIDININHSSIDNEDELLKVPQFQVEFAFKYFTAVILREYARFLHRTNMKMLRMKHFFSAHADETANASTWSVFEKTLSCLTIDLEDQTKIQ